MAKINILSKEIYNRISAGEVVERPYSAVKELVENSLDAGATEIEIYIEKGGKQYIRVTDNGSGIEKDDMRSAFVPHATSKIKAVEDLDKITTLGFRGEALASIAAISQAEIVSVTNGGEACKITCNGGVIGATEPAAWEKGTQVVVRNLFYNTPARAKFLKTDRNEESDITNFVSRFILGNPEVSFKYYTDGKLALQSHGGGLDEAVAQVYGAKVLPQCFKISAEKNGIKIYGFISNQNFFKPNKSYQSLFLNGRYIVNGTVSSAISNAYSSYAMKRQYPFYVLFIDVPTDFVDVNVHPNKADVRFVNNQLVYGAVYSIVSSVLDGNVRAADFLINSSQIPEVRSTMPENVDNGNSVYASEPKQNLKREERAEEQINVEQIIVEQPKEEKHEELHKEENKEENPLVLPNGNVLYPMIDEFSDPESIKMSSDKYWVTDDMLKEFAKYDDVGALEKELGAVDLSIDEFFPKSNYHNVLSVGEDYPVYGLRSVHKNVEKPKQLEFSLENCVYKGNLFNTYLIYEINDDAYLIDQHAAHERLIYDKLKKSLNERKVLSQGMLVPYAFSVNATEKEFIDEHIKTIRSFGFDIAPLGPFSYRVNEVPLDLHDIDLKGFFDELLSDLDSLKEIKLEDILKDKIAVTACKHAVKGGMQLTQEEIDELFKLMEGNIGLKCPHGRPVCVNLNKKSIEKMFKRKL